VKIRGYGIEIDLPDGWEGRIYKREDGRPVMHAGDFPIPARDGDFGGDAVSSMDGRGVFVALAEFDPLVAGRGLFGAPDPGFPIRPRDVSHRAMNQTRPGLAGVQRFFTTRGRAFCLYLVVGSQPDRHTLLEAANAVLETLAIGPWAEADL
jgi:hypothetical protein